MTVIASLGIRRPASALKMYRRSKSDRPNCARPEGGLRTDQAHYLSASSRPGLDDLAMIGEAIEQRSGHLGIGDGARPFPEDESGGDYDRGAFVNAC